MENRYLLFAGDTHYPKGGAEDYQGAFRTIQNAIIAHLPGGYEYEGGWANIFDSKRLRIVKKFKKGNWYDGYEDISFL